MFSMMILPICLLIWTLIFIKNKPQDIGLKPVGDDATDTQSSNLLQSGLTYSEATKTVIFWLIGITGFFTFYSILSLLSHTFLLIQDMGYGADTATNALMFVAGMSITGKFLFSSLANFFNVSPYKIFAFCCVRRIHYNINTPTRTG